MFAMNTFKNMILQCDLVSIRLQAVTFRRGTIRSLIYQKSQQSGERQSISIGRSGRPDVLQLKDFLTGLTGGLPSLKAGNLTGLKLSNSNTTDY
jgi:hypothetical protein